MRTVLSIGVGMRTLKIITLSFILVAAIASTVMIFIVPLVVDHGIRTRLESAGFARASFSVSKVTLDRIELLDVSLQKGLDLGDVVIEAGPYQLWRGDRATVVLRGAAVDLHTQLAMHSSTKPLPFDRIVIEDSHVTADRERISVHGSVDLRGREPAFDLVAEAPLLHLGLVEVVDAAASVRGPLTAIRACATGRVQTAQVDACLALDARQHQSAELSLAAHDARFSATGGGLVRFTNDGVTLENGHIDATVPALAVRGVALQALALHADVTADLGRRSFHVDGAMHAGELAASKVVLHDVSLPVSFDGDLDTLALHSDASLVASAANATITAMGRSLRIDHPVLRGTGTLALSNVQITAGAAESAFEIATTLRGIPLDDVVSMATHDRVRATGLLDGTLAFGIDEHGLSLVDASLAARTAGTLRAKELDGITIASFEVHKRVAAALADFAYTNLTLALDDPSTLRLSLAGRGKRVMQELAVDINVRGLLAQRN